MTGETFVAVDDISANITYRKLADWFSNFGVSDVFNSTLSTTNVSGSTVQFKFTGTQVAVVGSVVDSASLGSPVSTYSVDDDDPLTFTAGSDTVDQVFFGSAMLDATEHELVITVVEDGPIYALDYIAILSLDEYEYGPSPTYITTVFPTGTSGASPDTSTAALHVGPIVGGVVAGLLFIAAAAALAIWLLWFRRRKAYGGQIYHSMPAIHEPDMAAANPPHRQAAQRRDTAFSSVAFASPTAQQLSPSAGNMAAVSPSSPVFLTSATYASSRSTRAFAIANPTEQPDEPVASGSGAAAAQIPPSPRSAKTGEAERSVRYESDSGLRFGGQSSDAIVHAGAEIDAPPSYSE